jgi:uncharacterized membrane-anchored protein YitT (DUF2179 family)
MTKVISILTGSVFLSIGINGFVVPYHILDGGMIGIGLIIKYLWGIKAGLTIIILSIPIYAVAWFYYRPFFFNSLHGLLVSSFFIDLFSPINHHVYLPPVFSAIVGGCLIGIGIGVMLAVKVSTGGTDLLALFIANKTSINVGLIIFMIDALVLFIGFETIGINLLFSAITIGCVGLSTSLITSRFAKRTVT